MARRALQEINAGSMADIAFLLLIFFLVTTQMNADQGLLRKLPPKAEEQPDDPQIKVKERNIFVVLVNANDQLLVEGQPMVVSNLREKTKEFITPHPTDETFPETQDTILKVPGLGEKRVTLTKQVVSLQHDNATSYDMYIQVQNELIAAYNELRNDLAMEWYGKPFSKLTEAQADPIQTVYPQRISEAEPKETGAEAAPAAE